MGACADFRSAVCACQCELSVGVFLRQRHRGSARWLGSGARGPGQPSTPRLAAPDLPPGVAPRTGGSVHTIRVQHQDYYSPDRVLELLSTLELLPRGKMA